MVSRFLPKRRPWNTLRAKFEILKYCNLTGRFWGAFLNQIFVKFQGQKLICFQFILLDTMRIAERATDRQNVMSF